MYGALGSELSLIPLMAIAGTVTAIGRMDIMLVKKTAERMYPDALVVYGEPLRTGCIACTKMTLVL